MVEVEEGILWVWRKWEQTVDSSVLYEWTDEALVFTSQQGCHSGFNV
jgi:hypothetical protein